jgi:TolB-like protein
MRFAALLVLLPAVAAAASAPAVAVMPFKDLSGGKGSVGEAIRETVTTDLRDVPGMKVIERGNIDKILVEQNLQSRKDDLDPMSTVKVGKLLGATLIVGGAYQKAGSTVRLTARFVKVETGEIVGTAKVDGPQTEFLKLQDRVTGELLKSAGIGQKHVDLFAKRVRPKVKSFKTFELYGDAVIETDDKKKADFLKAALNEDPEFTYALRDLDELEKRLKQYDALNRQETDAQLKSLFDQVKTEKDGAKLFASYSMIFARLSMQRRWHKLVALARHLQKNPPPKSPPPYPDTMELVLNMMISAQASLRDWDGVLRDGEKFLASYPGSLQFAGVRAQVDNALEHRRATEEGKAKLAESLKKLSAEERSNPCKVAELEREASQWREARKDYQVCADKPKASMPPVLAVIQIAITSLELGDFPAVRKALDKLKTLDATQYKSMAALEMTMPTDGS